MLVAETFLPIINVDATNLCPVGDHIRMPIGFYLGHRPYKDAHRILPLPDHTRMPIGFYLGQRPNKDAHRIYIGHRPYKDAHRILLRPPTIQGFP